MNEPTYKNFFRLGLSKIQTPKHSLKLIIPLVNEIVSLTY